MAAITAAMVKELRERTGLGMMECKKALVESEGSVDAAIEELRKSSGLKAAKKAGRTAAEGVSLIKISDDHTVGLILEVNSETDFVARDDNFINFANDVLDVAFKKNETDVTALMAGDLEAKRASRDADPAWANYLSQTEGMVQHQEDRIMAPASFSPGAN